MYQHEQQIFSDVLSYNITGWACILILSRQELDGPSAFSNFVEIRYKGMMINNAIS